MHRPSRPWGRLRITNLLYSTALLRDVLPSRLKLRPTTKLTLLNLTPGAPLSKISAFTPVPRGRSVHHFPGHKSRHSPKDSIAADIRCSSQTIPDGTCVISSTTKPCSPLPSGHGLFRAFLFIGRHTKNWTLPLPSRFQIILRLSLIFLVYLCNLPDLPTNTSCISKLFSPGTTNGAVGSVPPAHCYLLGWWVSLPF